MRAVPTGKIVGSHFRLVRISDSSAGDQFRLPGGPVGGVHLEHPARTVRIAVGELRACGQRIVDLNHLRIEGDPRRSYPFAGFDGGAGLADVDLVSAFLAVKATSWPAMAEATAVMPSVTVPSPLSRYQMLFSTS